MPINSTSGNVLFITEKNLKDLGIVSSNVDSALLTPVIKLTQETELNRLLGTGLYSHLQDAILANTLNADEIFLLNSYVQQVLIWGTAMNLPLFLTYRYANAGIVRVQGDNSALPTLAEIQALKDEAKEMFGYYSNRMILHIVANMPLFPSYTQIRTLEDTPPAGNGFKNPFYTGDSSYFGWVKKLPAKDRPFF